jgi:mRNA-degrading endonuclease toxin of MazEF toxin-antitoxin module
MTITATTRGRSDDVPPRGCRDGPLPECRRQWFQAASSPRRPGDVYNSKLQNVVVTAITSNLKHAGDPASFLIDVSTPEGKASGLIKNSVVSCLNIATIDEALIARKIGQLPPPLMDQVNLCLKHALGLP